MPTSSAAVGSAANFSAVATCNAYRRIAQSMSPAELAENAAAVDRFSAPDAARFGQRLDYYQAHKASCEDFDFAHAYEAAAAAVESGDTVAGQCLLSGSLPEPRDEAALAALYRRYPGYVQDALRLGLDRGDWGTVIAAAGGIREPHGITGRMGLSPDQKYTLLKLAYLGADSESLQRVYAGEMKKLAPTLEGQRIAEASRRADALFAGTFGGRKPAADSAAVCPDRATP